LRTACRPLAWPKFRGFFFQPWQAASIVTPGGVVHCPPVGA
jgi:hypothetical protein